MTTREESGPDLGRARETTRAVADRLRDAAASRVEEAVAELPAIARRVRTLLLVLAISIPVFLAALVAILWRVAS